MAFASIAYTIPQYENYPNWWIKAFEPATTTPKIMAIDPSGSPTVAKIEINSDGFPETAGGALVIPYINGAYDLWLFPTEAEADANNTTSAIKFADNLTNESNNTVDTVGLLTNYTFDTVADMLAGVTTGGITVVITLGMELKTLGYSAVDDGGASTYSVESGAADGYVNHDFGGGVLAKLITNGSVSHKQCGIAASGDNTAIKSMFDELPDDYYLMGDISLTLITGNDSGTAFYHFDSLLDALVCAGRVQYNNRNATIDISIPNGEHEFAPIILTNYQLPEIDIRGESESGTLIRCGLDRTDWGVWMTLRNSSIGEMSGFTLLPNSNVVGIIDTATVCQEWTGEGPPPWPTDEEIKYFLIINSAIKRLTAITASGDVDNTECRLGQMFDFNGSNTKCELVNIKVLGLRGMASVYDGAVIDVSYGGFEGENVYSGVVVHQAMFHCRELNFRGTFNGATYFAGSQALNCDRGTARIFSGTISYCDRKFSGNGGVIFDGMATSTAVGVVFRDSDAGNFITTREDSLPADLTLSNNVISGNLTTPEARSGIITYTGDAVGSRVIADIPLIKKAWLRRVDGTEIVFGIKGYVGKLAGANAIFINTTSNTITVYSAMNVLAVDYELMWEC